MNKLQINTPRWAIPALQPSRYIAIWGGRGSGKSHFLGERVVEAHAMNQNESTVCIREIQKSLDQSVKRLIEQKIQTLNAGYYFTVQDAQIKSNHGNGIMTFQGMQNHTADSIKSLEGYQRAWIEEAQTLSQYSLDLIRPTIRTPGSELWFSWNPRYKTDPVDMFFRKNKRDNATVLRVNWNDNPWFPPELRKEMEDDFAIDPDKAEHIWNGAYGSGQGAILAKWVNQAERDGRIGVLHYDKEGAPIEISCDLGFRDTASFWYWQKVLGGFHLLRYDADTGMDADDWIDRIKHNLTEMGAKLGKIWMPHDAKAKTFQSKHTSIEKFMAGFGVDKCAVVPQTKKLDQIEAARTVIQKCAFNREMCENGLDGLTAWEFVYNDDTGTFSREPKHDVNSHPSDAFAYGCQVMQEFMPELPKDDEPRGIHVGQTKVTLNEMWQSIPKQSGRL